jgi:acyl-coenzyme A synthetase/AMP-(fatty) acid ligase
VCFGVPHPTWGEEVAAAVVVRDGVDGSDCWRTAGAALPTSSGPKQIYITERIPRTATGKIQRGVVAKAFIPNAS